MKIGSLFSGYGGLEMGVQAVLGGETAWHVEFDDAPSKVLAHNWPGVPNYGDITAVDWSAVEPIDILTGGFPCQDLSLAGRRAGMRPGTRSGLWADFRTAIGALTPSLVVIENVSGLVSGCAESDLEPCPGCLGEGEHRPVLRALGRVLGDLAEIGYDAEWCGVRASDAGAPHQRLRYFVLAHPQGQRRHHGHPVYVGAAGGTGDVPGDAGDVVGRETRAPQGSADTDHIGGHGSRGARHGWTEFANGSPADSGNEHRERRGNDRDMVGPAGAREADRQERQRDGDAADDSELADLDWGPFEPAIRHWESCLGRLAPAPTSAGGKNGNHRLSPQFVEWMMGLPAGHVTDPAIGITRAQQLKALGNGVVPQQAALALTHLLSRKE